MRSLILLFFLPTSAFTSSLGFDYSQSESFSDISNLSEDVSTIKTQSLGTSIELTLPKGFSYNAKLEQRSVDYTNYLILPKEGFREALEDEVSEESYLDQSISFANGPHEVSLSYFTHLSSSPLAQQGQTINYNYTFNQKLTKLLTSTTYFEQKRPEDYFQIAAGSPREKRAEKIFGKKLSLGVEHIFSERYKARGTIFQGQRLKERPSHLGVELYQKYALTDAQFLGLKLERIEENTSEDLENERGYFDQQNLLIEYTAEPIYDLLASISYGHSVETEDNPRDESTEQLGIDSYGLGIDFQNLDYTLALSLLYSETNTNLFFSTISGGIQWDF